MSEISVWVNDSAVVCDVDFTLEQLLEQLAMPLAATAVAINQQIIARSQWSQHVLNEGDRIALFQAIAGG